MQIGTPSEIYAKPASPFVAGFIGVSNFIECEVSGKASDALIRFKDGLELRMRLSREYAGKATLSARPEQLSFAKDGMSGKTLFSTFLGDFIEYEVQLDDGQNLIVNEYTKDPTVIHPIGEQVHIRFDPASVSLYESETGEVLVS